ncbi:cation diffusion facilitator family transporter [Jannaschia ovalis]|uniref:Cation diffusion facilitator family transporter n=1 Tax=Jannaschia ovalis TaxID=3038773 RepID=A0ABY8LG44_9RHOB|nr:cation diffusion facilitator family transporter [Jannaschia sp. GRR-S6-38]WGH79320.1 cation diffusion facilitator family transporter [Jannaschia sp. GRR-S6-38]
MLALKALAWRLTGSVAFLSDALESLVNVATAGVTLLALRVAARPADARHNWGHHKAEMLAAVGVGVLIVLSALAILREAALALRDPAPLVAPWAGIMVNLGAGVLNAIWCAVLFRTAKAARSRALAADARHLLSDVMSSAGVAVGVVLVALTGFAVLDPILGTCVALVILWSGWGVVQASLGGLMDEAVSPAAQTRLRAVIAETGAEAVQAHDIRTRHAGAVSFMEFHLVVPGDWSVARAHALCDRIEAALHAAEPGVQVTIHVEPEEKAKTQPGAIDL